ncbi:MAG: GWxTD domain-containing protein, partial [Gemmatimonadales bacterium]|nr:GWxTD domain-containing protein [Gemmatimonadales bacterium]
MRGTARELRGIALAGGLIVATATAVPAQSPADRLALTGLRDSLAAIGDTAALRREYRASIGRDGPARRHPLAQLRLGLTALRLAELGADPDAGQALSHLRRVSEQHPGWPFAWHAEGLAETVRALWEQGDRLALGSRVGLGTLERAAGRHHRALDADGSYAPAALALAAIALGLRDTALFPETRDALRRAVRASRQAPADLLLAWGRIERAAGDPDSADLAFQRYAAAAGSVALSSLERARTGLAAGRTAAESLYFAGAASDDSGAVAGYRADLAPIAEDSQLARFDRLSGAERAGYLQRFWTDRDRYEMRADGERLREHYRRLLHARRSFALTVSRRFYGPADAYRSGSEELDDRGVIYVRHGEPAERLRPFVFGLMPNESWRYTRAEGDLLFHFSSGYDASGGGDLYDYRLVESVMDLRGAAEAPVDQLMLSRQTLSPVYARMLNWGAFGKARSRARERGIGQASIAVGTTTDSYE